MGSSQLTLDELVAAVVEKGIKHYGVKGMKWGVRKKRTISSTTVSPGGRNTGRTKVELSDADKAKSKTLSDDAARAATSQAKVKTARSTSSLSNKELQDLVTRMNLEQQYDRLNESQKSAGAKFIQQLLIGAGKQQAQQIVNQEVGRQVGASVGRRYTSGNTSKKNLGPEKRQY